MSSDKKLFFGSEKMSKHVHHVNQVHTYCAVFQHSTISLQCFLTKKIIRVTVSAPWSCKPDIRPYQLCNLIHRQSSILYSEAADLQAGKYRVPRLLPRCPVSFE